MLARRAGLDLAQAFEVIAASSGTSFVHETEGQVILNGSYDIGFTLDLALKDLGARARSSAPTRACRSRSPACRERFDGGARALRRRGVVADGREAARGRGRYGPAGAGLSGHA